jgi:hypothetical protein
MRTKWSMVGHLAEDALVDGRADANAEERYASFGPP